MPDTDPIDPSPGSKLQKALLAVLKFFTNPIVFLVVLAPTVITQALGIIKGKLALQGESSPYPEVFSFLSNEQLPGLIDYVLQYYTALLAGVLWVFMAVEVVLFPFIAHRVNNHGNSGTTSGVHSPPDGSPRLIFIIASIVWVFYMGYVFAYGAASDELLGKYIEVNPELGKQHLPIWTSPITIVRIGIGFLWIPLAVFQSQKKKG